MIRSSCLLLALAGLAHAQEHVSVDVRGKLEPPAPVAVDSVLFGPCMYGVVVAEGEKASHELGGRPFELAVIANELEIRSPGQKKPERLKKAGTVELATPTGLARLACTPFCGPLPGVVTSKKTTVWQWHVQRLDGRTVHFDALPSLVLLDANLNGCFTDFGVDLVLQGQERIAIRWSKILHLGGRWWSARHDEASDELALGALEQKLGTLDVRDSSSLPATVDRIVLVSEDGDDALFPVAQEALRLPPGAYRLRHAVCGEAYEVLAPESDPAGRRRLFRTPSKDAWCTVKIEEPARPVWGAPYRLNVHGIGFQEPDERSGTRTSSSFSGRVLFYVHGVLVCGRAGEIWDVPRTGAFARVAEVCSFAETAVRIHTTQQDGKESKPETWSFAKRGIYESASTVSERTASFTVELERKPFGKLSAVVPLGNR